jgi:UPF0755 protein
MELPEIPSRRQRVLKRFFRKSVRFCLRSVPLLGALVLVLFSISSLYAYFWIYQPDASFPVRTIITIPEGSTIRDVAILLETQQVTRSRLALEALLRYTQADAQVKAGDYFFDHPLTILEVAHRITAGEYGLEPIQVVVPEGSTTYEMAELFDAQFERFDPSAFLLVTQEKEGYLYPDTYTFLPNVTTAQVLETLERTFYERIQTIESDIIAFGRPIHEIITMASLLEKEAWDHEERRAIAGVLWERISINMPLQVDAVFGFINRTQIYSPKFSDLEVDSPYNTYKYKGLPPGPIGSPSLSAIQATITPIPTDALFYLHGKDGSLRIAKTYEEHLVNRRKYLD